MKGDIPDIIVANNLSRIEKFVAQRIWIYGLDK